MIMQPIFIILASLLTLISSTVSQATEVGSIDSAIHIHENRGGFAVYIGDREDAVDAFIAREHYSLHVLSPDEAFVDDVRNRLNEADSYGRCSAELWDGSELPYIENLVSLLICDDAESVEREETLRVLSPGGLALFRNGDEWESLRKPLLTNTDDWPQHLYDSGNNPVSRDVVVAPPRHLQWRGSPRRGRFHEKMSSFAAMVAKNERVFYIMDEGSPASILFPSDWQLTARDAYNGTVLWKRPIENWVTRLFPYKAGPSTVPRRLVASDDAIYVTLGIDAPLSKLDPATGETLMAYEGTEKTDEIILSGELLLLVVRDQHVIPSTNDDIALPGGGLTRNFWAQDEPARLKSLDPTSGEILWETQMPIAPLTTGAGINLFGADATINDNAGINGRTIINGGVGINQVYLCDYESVVAIDRETGETVWTSSDINIADSYAPGYAPRLVVSDGVVLFTGSENVMKHSGGSWATPSDRLVALSAETGDLIWEAEHPASGFLSPEDIFVINGTVWFGATKDGRQAGPFYGIDLHNGEVLSTFEPDNVSYWFHQRCYMQKATDNYILSSRTGIEFVDPVAEHWDINHWVRGACTYGVMPANGLTYAPQHPCACYSESKLSGMNALSSTQRYSLDPDPTIERLQKGPAYDSLITAFEAVSGEWPQFRGGPERSSYLPVRLSGSPSQLWEVEAGRDLTSPIAAAGMIFAAEEESHTVFAASMEDGSRIWSFTAGGRIDSPPAYALGRIVFGSRDGYVYCLNAHDGALRWRFLAAPQDKRIINFEQLESVWPVFGSVLIHDKSVCLTAGRSLFLDGGVTFYRLDLATGEPLATKQWDQIAPDGTEYHSLVSTMQEDADLAFPGYGLTMPPANNDLLSAKDENLFMKSQVLTRDGERVMYPIGARNEGNERSHIFSPTGLLDDSWWHRSYQTYGNGVEGGYAWFQSLKRVVNGKILCTDEENVYGFGRKARFQKWTVPLEFELFSYTQDARGNETEPNWSIDIPILVRAMLVTDDVLIVCGPRDLYDEEAAVAPRSGFTTNDPRLALQQEHWEGKHGSILKIFDKNTGNEISSLEIDDTPAWEGMIIAGGKIFMTTVNGRILCFDVR
jgi:outer membrane protein assembly factor BamB